MAGPDDEPAGEGSGPPPVDPAWSALASDAAAIDGAAAPGSPDEPGQAPPAALEAPTNADTVAVLVKGFRELSCALLQVESPQRTLADPIADRLGAVLGGVCDRHGWQLADTMGRYGPDFAAAMLAGPVLLTAYRELDAELKAKRKRAPIDIDATAATAATSEGAKPDATAPGGPPGPDAASGGRVNVGTITPPAFRE